MEIGAIDDQTNSLSTTDTEEGHLGPAIVVTNPDFLDTASSSSTGFPTSDTQVGQLIPPIAITNTRLRTTTSSSSTEFLNSDTDSDSDSDFDFDSESASDSSDIDSSNSTKKKSSSSLTIGLAVGISAGVLLIIGSVLVYVMLRINRRRRGLINAGPVGSEENGMDDIYAIGGANEPMSPRILDAAHRGRGSGQNGRSLDLFGLPPQYYDLPDADVDKDELVKGAEKKKEKE
ncbi:hypothetical protein LPJ56_002824 [Coemansia sp. RSA 2599]|nr:hypothetical protein LPJ56_002824 [Coemansia sp. RSA 2599]